MTIWPTTLLAGGAIWQYQLSCVDFSIGEDVLGHQTFLHFDESLIGGDWASWRCAFWRLHDWPTRHLWLAYVDVPIEGLNNFRYDQVSLWNHIRNHQFRRPVPLDTNLVAFPRHLEVGGVLSDLLGCLVDISKIKFWDCTGCSFYGCGTVIRISTSSSATKERVCMQSYDLAWNHKTSLLSMATLARIRLPSRLE